MWSCYIKGLLYYWYYCISLWICAWGAVSSIRANKPRLRLLVNGGMDHLTNSSLLPTISLLSIPGQLRLCGVPNAWVIMAARLHVAHPYPSASQTRRMTHTRWAETSLLTAEPHSSFCTAVRHQMTDLQLILFFRLLKTSSNSSFHMSRVQSIHPSILEGPYSPRGISQSHMVQCSISPSSLDP